MKKKIKMLFATLALMLGVGVGTSVATASHASAYMSNCSAQIIFVGDPTNYWEIDANCGTNGGLVKSMRAKVRCSNGPLKYGPWVYNYNWHSLVFCPQGTSVTYYGMDLGY